MSLPIVENLRGLRGTNWSNYIKLTDFSLIPHVWGPLGCCHFQVWAQGSENQ